LSTREKSWISSTDPQSQPEATLIAKPLADLPVITCAAPAYLKKYGTPRELQDLKEHRLVGFFSGRSGQVYPPEFDGISREDFFHHPQLLFNDSNAYHCAALEGLGIIQNSVAVLAPYLRTGQLVQILPHAQCTAQKVWLVYAANRRGSLKVKLFALWCEQVFAAQQSSWQSLLKTKSMKK
jgi:LysR family transcriptional regulator, regulator for bpeEF and oprC